MKQKPLYLDEAASTGVSPKTLKAMEPFFLREYGNPSSPHEMGESAKRAVHAARATLAKKIAARPWELFFTSGVTEANNWVLQGLARAHPMKKKVIVSALEHAAIMETCDYLELRGYTIVKIPVNSEGLLRFDVLEKEINDKTLLVSVMHVNNVLGVVQDIARIGALCRKRDVLFHTDASQSFGKIQIDVNTMKIDLLSASAHKVGGPKGIGFLYIREGVGIKPLIFGGGQEKGMRGGTENVPGVVGFAAALTNYAPNVKKIAQLRDYCIEKLEAVGGTLHGSQTERIFNNIHTSFPGVNASTLVTFLSHKGIYIGTGSACESKREQEDHVLAALGLSSQTAKAAIRITLPATIEKKDITRLVKELAKALKTLKVR